jgi:hypothetical protein
VEISAFAPICGKPCEQQNHADVIAETGHLIMIRYRSFAGHSIGTKGRQETCQFVASWFELRVHPVDRRENESWRAWTTAPTGNVDQPAPT